MSSAENQKPDKSPKPPKIKTGPGCLSRLFGLTGIVITLILLAAFIYGLKYSAGFLAPETESREVVVEIPAGAGPQQISKILEEKGLIKDAEAFVLAYRIKSKLSKKPLALKAGEMILDPSKNAWETIDLLVAGKIKLYPFTVPEGKNMREIAQLIQDAGLGSKDDFLALCKDKAFISSLGMPGVENLEGYLFPDTYNFPKGTTMKTVATKMVERFFAVWDKYKSQADEKSLNMHEVVTLASIVEKETGAPKERPVIAGVFWNRLTKGMRLETDPTVIYGIENYDGNITKKDLRANHPYNTYVIFGLPPGPIASPGEAAIAAVIKPDIVPYLFFVSKNDGTHHFSETLTEHNRMVNKYQRSGGGNSN